MISKKLKKFVTTLTMAILLAQPVYAATYKVVPKDSLYSISKLFGTSVASLKSTNKLSSDIIYPGEALNVSANTYTVVKGDSLYLITKKFNVSLENLRKANNKWDNMIYPGDVFLIPSKDNGQAIVKTNNTNSTLTSTKKSSSSTTKGVISYTSADLDLLSRLVKAEAGGESYKTKVCVAAVVINRVQSNQFPNTIKNVIYQKSDGYYQFTPVLNGMINKSASSDDKKATIEALNGADPTNGALYFFDNTVTNKWLTSKKVAARFDKMTFSY